VSRGADGAESVAAVRRFADRAALVTGGASGIGRGVAERLAAEGALVATLDQVRHDPVGSDGRAVALTADVTVESQVAEAVTRVVDTWGRLDVVVNAAGVGAGVVPLTELDLDVWRTVMSVNVDGAMLVSKHAGRALAAGGVVVNIASVNAEQPAKGMAPYCVSKAALAMLTRVSALDLAPRDVRVVAVAPGLVDTPMTRPGVTGVPETLRSMLESVPLGRIGRPQDVAALVCFLASEEASFITGTTVSADGGMGLRGYPDRPGVPPPTAR
jgi:NAD(P)-dependent dehydrogenase (short-subunit alcohol dehydrogenase family)